MYESLIEYNRRKKLEKANKTKTPLTESEKEMREFIWSHLLEAKEGQNAYQALSKHVYLPKPNPREEEINQGYITIHEAQSRFMQTKSGSFVPGTTLEHLDLTSAYATALADLETSLKYKTSYKLNDLEFILDDLHEDYMNVVDVRIKMLYTPTINLYAPNTKMIRKSRPVNDHNVPKSGEEIEVNIKLLQSKSMKINGLQHFLVDLENEFIITKYISVKVTAYDYIERPKLYTYDELNLLLHAIKLMNKQQRSDAKAALVSLSGMLKHIDPSMRLIMLGKCEEIIHMIRAGLIDMGAEILGVQIDAIYYLESDWMKSHPNEIKSYIKTAIVNVLKINVDMYGIQDFVKIETWGPDRYKETPFRLQEVR